jgi:hypothetical protein
MAAVAIDALFLPALLNGVGVVALGIYLNHELARRATPEAITHRKAKKERRTEKKAARLAEPRPARLKGRLVGQRLSSLWRTRVRPSVVGRGASQVWTNVLRLPLRFVGHRLLTPPFRWWWALPYKNILLWTVLYVFFVPWTYSLLTLLVAIVVQLRLQRVVYGWTAQGRISGRLEAVLVGCVVAGVVGVRTLVNEVLRPGPLPVAQVHVVGQRAPLVGAYIAKTAEDLYVGVNRRLVVIPSRLVDQVSIRRPLSRKPERAQTLVSRLH